MRKAGRHSQTPIVRALVLGSVLTTMTGSGDLGAAERESGTDRWQGKEIAYELSGESDSDIRFSKSPRECRITTIIDGATRSVTLREEDIEVDGEHLDLGSYDDVSLSAARDFLILKLVTTRSWSASGAGSATTQATSGTSATSTSRTSRSQTSGRSTDHHAFGFTDLKGMKIRIRVKGGRSVDCSITTGTERRVIRFDVDGGRNEGTIVIRPGLLDVDGVRKRVEDDAQVLLTATKGSLSITADGAKVWSRD